MNYLHASKLRANKSFMIVMKHAWTQGQEESHTRARAHRHNIEIERAHSHKRIVSYLSLRHDFVRSSGVGGQRATCWSVFSVKSPHLRSAGSI